MAPAPVTAQHVYGLLRHEITAGEFTPGMLLNLNKLTRRFGTSAAPVRDALHRLIGERLLEFRPGGGFQVRAPSADQLAGLYRWHGQLVHIALCASLAANVRKQTVALPGEVDGPEQAARIASELFRSVAVASGNEELLQALDAATLALSRARAQEPRVMPGIAQEILDVIGAVQSNGTAAFRRTADQYHRRRIRMSQEIHQSIQNEIMKDQEHSP